jgi:hypothetical protein
MCAGWSLRQETVGFDRDADLLVLQLQRRDRGDNVPARPATIRFLLMQPGSTGGIGR